MRRVLFIDDELRVLDGLRDLLRKYRKRWDVQFALGGAAGLAELDREMYDVVVTDMRMPEVDGARVLEYARARHPGVVRIVLSGHAEVELALRTIPEAHQFLAKPCDSDVLENVIERACSLRSLIDSSKVRESIGRLGQLPSAPRVHVELTALMTDPRAGAAEAAEVMARDPAMSAKLLQLVNSAFFGLPRRVTNISHAVVCLGMTTLRNLCLGAGVFASSSRSDIDLDALEQHSYLVAQVARRLVPEALADDAMLAGLLHDVGLLVLAEADPGRLATARARAREMNLPMAESERAVIGVSHAEVGGYLLGLWGLPYPIVEAVANHHAPEQVPQREFDALSAVHVAEALCEERASTAIPGLRCDATSLPEYLARFGLEPELPRFQRIAADLAEVQAAR